MLKKNPRKKLTKERLAKFKRTMKRKKEEKLNATYTDYSGTQHNITTNITGEVAKPNDPINPTYYKSNPSGIECIVITRHMNFNLGNVVKYIWRGAKLQDLKKAAWYLKNEIERIEFGYESKYDRKM